MGSCCATLSSNPYIDNYPQSLNKDQKKLIKTLVFTDSEDEDHLKQSPQQDLALPTNSSAIMDIGSFNTRIGLSDWHHPKSLLTLHNDSTSLFSKIYQQDLQIDSKEYSLLLTESLYNANRKHRESTLELLFEKFNVPQLQIFNQSILSLFAEGIVTGLSIDCGYQGTQIMPIFDGQKIGPATKYLATGGKKIEEYLLNKNCYKIHEFIKQYCYIALNYEQEVESIQPITIDLPDQQKITLKQERIECGELLFKNEFIRNIKESIKLCDNELLAFNQNKIVLSGGNTLIKGFNARMIKEGFQIVGNQPNEIKSWIGGEILQGLSSFQSQWMRKEQYAEFGNRLVDYNLY